MFSKRFDVIMNIAEVSNSVLGRDVHMSPSYIGRLRSGVRPLPKNHDYIPSICRYLAKHIVKDYQILSLQKLIGIDEKSLSSVEDTAIYIEKWLLEKEDQGVMAADILLNAFSAIETAERPIGDKTQLNISSTGEECFFGNEGKRKAVEEFFLLVLQAKKPRTLLLYSDESMDWLLEDELFAKRWAQLFQQIILQGNRVKVIHTLSRDINDMVEAVSKWLPIYMTGMVAPYYYPRLRDGVFNQTLFIAPGIAAITSSSVAQDTNGMLNLLLRSPTSIAALNLEYDNYMKLCRPLMHIFTERNMGELEKFYYEFNDNEADVCIYSKVPPLFTMPETLVREMASGQGTDELVGLWEKELEQYQSRLMKHSVTICLPAKDTDVTDSKRFCFSEAGVLESRNYTYSDAQYRQHLEYLNEWEKGCDNLRVKHISKVQENVVLYVIDGIGAIVIKLNKPMVAFVVDERNITNALWDYLKYNM